jgi:hypothetical protein
MSFLLFALASLLALSTVGMYGWRLLQCDHPHELFDRFPDGRPALRCARCQSLRPNILLGTPQYHRTQDGGPIRPLPWRGVTTGIERVWAELDEPITDADLFPVEVGR